MRLGAVGDRGMMSDREEPFPYDPAYRSAVLLGDRRMEDLPECFGVVTAHNPDGRQVGDGVNDRAHARLELRVREMGLESFGVTGASPDGVHREEGLGIAGADLQRVWGLAREFCQQAFFWVSGGWVYVCDDASGRGWKAGRLEERYYWRSP